MTTNANRTVHFYTLVPSIIDEPYSHYTINKDIKDIFDRITSRHNKSKSILGSGVMSENEYAEIKLDGEIDVEQLTRDSDFLKTIGGLGAESMINHTAILEQYRSRAENLPEYLLSARSYSKPTPRMFVLIEYNNRYIPIIFDLKNKQIENLGDFSILDLISCTDSTPRALARPAVVEHLANEAVNYWCSLENILINYVRKVCALYLVPINEPVDIKILLKDQ